MSGIEKFANLASGYRRLAAPGRLLALAVTLLAALAPHCVQAQTKFKLLYTFPGNPNGGVPFAGLVRDAAGNLYGATYNGGGHECDCGVVFKIDSTGRETPLHAFSGGPDGSSPTGTLVLDSDGNLYGTAGSGGIYGYGIVFKMNSAGHETVLYNFTADAPFPFAGLTRDTAGNLYGTTSEGGTSKVCTPYCGTVFEVDSSGTEKLLYTFTGGPDGSSPVAALIEDSGHFYGATFEGGGSTACSRGCGTIFQLEPTGAETVLYTFTGGPDGASPEAGVIRDGFGNLYGATINGGSSTNCTGGCGTVFKLDSNGRETVLHSFAAGVDGSFPSGSLVRDESGNLYGTTLNGGGSPNCPAGCGTVFKVDATGTVTLLHRFIGKADGQNPYAGLLLDSSGNLYGTTEAGSRGFGTVFELTQ